MEYTYNVRDQRTSVRNGRGQVTSWDYGRGDRLLRVTWPAVDGVNAVRTFAYDAVGNLIREETENGGILEYDYDALNRLKERRSAGGTAEPDEVVNTVYTRDAEGRVTGIADTLQAGGTKTETRALDAVGRIRQVVDRNGQTRKYDYNAADQRIAETDHTLGVTTHSYNARGGLASTTAPGLGETTYRYDGADRLVETAYANLAKTTRAYDAAGQLESLKHLRSGGTLHAETYVHDANGNRTSLTVEDGSTPQVTTYGYDVADRLISEVSSTRRVLDTLDAAGNRVGRLIQDGAGVQQQRLVYTVNARDQVTGIETRNGANAVTGTEVLVYDANGNRIGRNVGGVTQTHRYDRRNRELARGGVRYEHNDADVRTAQVDGALRTEWVMDGLSLQAEVRGGTTVAQYRYGRELIGEVRGAVGRTILSDGHRSPVVVLESTGNVTDRVRYSAGGEVRERTGSNPLAFGYGGYLTQEGTEELYAFARTYRPGLARFNEVDPLRSFDAQLGMGSHRYVLGYGNPIRYVDPDGRIGFLTALRDGFDESDRILRDMAVSSDSEFGFALASGARAFMGIGSVPARATNLASDLLAASLKPPKFAGVREDARRNLAPLGAALANPLHRVAGDTAIAAYDQAVQTTTLVMEGDRGAASDLMGAGLEMFAGGAVVKAGRFVDDVGRSAHLDLEMRDIDRQMYADAGTPRVVVERSSGDVGTRFDPNGERPLPDFFDDPRAGHHFAHSLFEGGNDRSLSVLSDLVWTGSGEGRGLATAGVHG